MAKGTGTFQKLVHMKRTLEKHGIVTPPQPKNPMFTKEGRNLKAKMAVEASKRDKSGKK